MPLLPKVPFVSGSVYTPEVATEMTGITFDDQPQYYGHFNKILDVDLSDAPGALKARVASNDLNLKVTAGAGLNAIYTSGLAVYGIQSFTITGSSLALAASTTNYIFVGIDGVVRATATQPPIVRSLLAVVTTNATGVVSVNDQRKGYKLESIEPLASTVKNFGGRGDSGAFVGTNVTPALEDGEYYFTDFTVPTGVTITVSKLAKIYCTGNVNIAGTINVTTASLGGSPFIAGFNGSYYSGQGLVGSGAGSAGGEVPGSTYSYLLSPVGSGGSSGGYIIVGNYTVTTKQGGDGGGCVWIEAAGSITVTGNINANGIGGLDAGFLGNTTNGFVLGAASGGSGGLVLLRSLSSLVISGVLSVRGGNGGVGLINANSWGAESGCGGGGGRIILSSPSINTTGSTLNLQGGLAGNNNASGATSVVLNGNGGSFGGVGGSASSAIGQPGGIGLLTTRLVSPVG